jgi:hypothetical protein
MLHYEENGQIWRGNFGLRHVPHPYHSNKYHPQYRIIDSFSSVPSLKLYSFYTLLFSSQCQHSHCSLSSQSSSKAKFGSAPSATPPTRLIPISVFQTPTSNPPSHSTKNNVYTTSASIPGALQACQESRRVSLKRWGLSIEEPGQLFFDVNTDILFLGHWVENNTELSKIGEDWGRDVVDRSDTQPGMVRIVERMWEET